MTVQQESTGCRDQLTSLSELENLTITVWPGVSPWGILYIDTNPFCLPKKSLGQKTEEGVSWIMPSLGAKLVFHRLRQGDVK